MFGFFSWGMLKFVHKRVIASKFDYSIKTNQEIPSPTPDVILNCMCIWLQGTLSSIRLHKSIVEDPEMSREKKKIEISRK